MRAVDFDFEPDGEHVLVFLHFEPARAVGVVGFLPSAVPAVGAAGVVVGEVVHAFVAERAVAVLAPVFAVGAQQHSPARAARERAVVAEGFRALAFLAASVAQADAAVVACFDAALAQRDVACRALVRVPRGRLAAALRALAGGRLVFLVVVVHGLSLPWFGRFPRPWVVLFFGRMTVGHLVRSPPAGGVAQGAWTAWASGGPWYTPRDDGCPCRTRGSLRSAGPGGTLACARPHVLVPVFGDHRSCRSVRCSSVFRVGEGLRGQEGRLRLPGFRMVLGVRSGTHPDLV